MPCASHPDTVMSGKIVSTPATSTTKVGTTSMLTERGAQRRAHRSR